MTEDIIKAELENCPFCGVNYKIRRNSITHPWYDIEAEGERCPLDGLGWDNSKKVINMLNTRATTDREKALVDALEAIIVISDRKHDAWDKAKQVLSQHKDSS